MGASLICSWDYFPAPAIGANPVELKDNNDGSSTSKLELKETANKNGSQKNLVKPGTLPDSAGELSTAARGLLKRMLEPDPKVRLKNLRQLQQTAFYMGFNFEHVKAKKVSPKTVLERYVPSTSSIPDVDAPSGQEFATFDQLEFPL